ALQRELADQRVAAQNLGLVFRCPAEERQEVDDRLGKITPGSQIEDVRRAASLTQLRSIHGQENRKVSEPRRLPAQEVVQQNVLRGAADPLVATQDVGDLHQVVVDHVRQVIRRPAVGLEQYLIVDQLVLEGDLATKDVVKRRLSGFWHRQTHDTRLAVPRSLFLLGPAEVTAEAIVARWLFARFLGRAHFGQPLKCTEAAVCVAARDELVGVAAVDWQALGLEVRLKRPSDLGPLVPLHAEPAQALVNRFQRAGGDPILIGIFDPQQERAAGVASVEPVEERGVNVADVREAGRARRVPNPRTMSVCHLCSHQYSLVSPHDSTPAGGCSRAKAGVWYTIFGTRRCVAMAIEQKAGLMTAEDLLCFTGDPAKRYELADGEVIEMSPPGGEHGKVTMGAGALVFSFARQH